MIAIQDKWVAGQRAQQWLDSSMPSHSLPICVDFWHSPDSTILIFPQAQRLLHKCTAELRKLQTERAFPNTHFPHGTDISDLGVSDFRFVVRSIDQHEESRQRREKNISDEQLKSETAAIFAEHDQWRAEATRAAELNELNESDDLNDVSRLDPEPTARAEAPASHQIPRHAKCACNSGQKYKRRCGKGVPAALRVA